MTQGTVILTPFPFTDLTGNKVRPAPIVSSSARKGNDLIIAFISSVYNPHLLQPTDFPVTKNSTYFASSGRKTDSVIKIDKLATIDRRIIIGELGTIGEEVMKEVLNKLRIVFDLK
ncbi:MAG: type II toxin-antitoxin system PemK/MazF family toxin [Bacteroidota bacterium]